MLFLPIPAACQKWETKKKSLNFFGFEFTPTELLTFDLLFGQPVPRLQSVQERVKNGPHRHRTAVHQEDPLDPPTLFLLYLIVRISARRFISRRAHWCMDFVTFEQRRLVCKQARNMLMTSTLSFALLSSPACYLAFFFLFFSERRRHITRQAQDLWIAATARHQGSKVHAIPSGLLCCCRC